MGPQHVTPEAADGAAVVDYVVAAEKREDDPLLAVRREICRRTTACRAGRRARSGARPRRPAPTTPARSRTGTPRGRRRTRPVLAGRHGDRGVPGLGRPVALRLDDPDRRRGRASGCRARVRRGARASARRSCSPPGTGSCCTTSASRCTSPPAAGCARRSRPGSDNIVVMLDRRARPRRARGLVDLVGRQPRRDRRGAGRRPGRRRARRDRDGARAAPRTRPAG